jgi:hypothetical protein
MSPGDAAAGFPFDDFRLAASSEEAALFERLTTPEAVQAFIADELRYNFEDEGESARGPLEVVRRRSAHCFEGAIFAAAVLWYHGLPPTLILLEAPEDFDHNLVVYWRDGRIGSVSQSRHPELFGKPAVFPTARDLALAYYPDYYSDRTGRREDLTLRGFSEPVDLRRFGSAWVAAPEVWEIYNRYTDGLRIERLFLRSEKDRFYTYPEAGATP